MLATCVFMMGCFPIAVRAIDVRPQEVALLRTIVISLDSHSHRWEAACRHLNGFGLSPERLRATRVEYSAREGILQSHTEALKRAAAAQSSTIVFEDDAVPHPLASLRNISTALKYVPNDYTIMWLGHCYCHEEGDCSTAQVGLPVLESVANCGHAYMVSPMGAARLLASDVMAQRTPGEEAIDEIYIEECLRLHRSCFVAAPALQRVAGTTTWGHGLFQQDWRWADSTNPHMDAKVSIDGQFMDDTMPGEKPYGMHLNRNHRLTIALPQPPFAEDERPTMVRV
mmetsp:Transcript_58168/g.96062  ORF Transcript_58168/g.96062 Transcript_58168/m.96062 type:complete len:284 (-) Transcript_58168:242-1093(-)